MKRFGKRFKELKEKGEAGFVPFVVLGDPDEETSFEIIKKLIESGADALELGFAFSDPIADGKAIQEADQRALANGMDTIKCINILKNIRELDSEIPISLLLYYNLIFQRGLNQFYNDVKQAGVDAVLAADCPLEEAQPLLKVAEKHGIEQVFIVSPTTTEKRLEKILANCSGYVYLVSVLGVTGARATMQERTIELIKNVRPNTSLPLLVGFGISRPEHVKEIKKAGADGAIVGSAIVNLIKDNLDDRQKMLSEIGKLALELKAATK